MPPSIPTGAGTVPLAGAVDPHYSAIMGRSVRWAVVVMAVAGLALGAGCSSGSDAAQDSAASSSPSSSTTTASTVPEPVPTTVPTGVIVVDFVDPASTQGWSTVNDTVMGGVSNSSVSWADGALVFAGTVSLENNGGFTSAVSPVVPGVAEAASEATAVVLTAQGDGRQYVVQLRSTTTGQQWTQSFTPPVELAEVVLPLEGFEASDFRLEPVAPVPVELAVVDRLVIYLTDGQAGPFRLSVSRIAVR